VGLESGSLGFLRALLARLALPWSCRKVVAKTDLRLGSISLIGC